MEPRNGNTKIESERELRRQGRRELTKEITSTPVVHQIRLLHRHSLYHLLRHHLMTLYPQKQPCSSFENNTGHTDRRTYGRTDGRTRHLIEMNREMRNLIIHCEEKIPLPHLMFWCQNGEWVQQHRNVTHIENQHMNDANLSIGKSIGSFGNGQHITSAPHHCNFALP